MILVVKNIFFQPCLQSVNDAVEFEELTYLCITKFREEASFTLPVCRGRTYFTS